MRSLAGYLKFKKSSQTEISIKSNFNEEVFIKRLFLITTALVGLSTNLQAKNNSEKTAKPVEKKEDDALFFVKPSNSDLDFGQNLLNFHRDLDNYSINEKALSFLNANIKKATNFAIVNENIERSTKISKIKDLKNFYDNCDIKYVKSLSYTGSISERFDITIDKYCRNKFLDLVTIQGQFNFKDKEGKFFTEAAPFYADGESESRILSLLSKIKKDEEAYKFVSNSLIKNYIELKNKPNDKMLAALKPNNDLNLFLKMNAHLDKKSSSFFYDEFQKLNRLVQESIQNENFKLAKNRVDIAIDFYNKNKKYLDRKRVWNSLVNTGRTFYTKGRDQDAIEVFQKALAISPEDNYSEAVFYSLWVHIANQDYKELKKAIDKLDLEEKFDQLDSKIQFWIASSYFHTGNKTKANNYFNRIITSSPFSFYSIIALKELAQQNKTETEDQILSKLIATSQHKDFPLEKLSSSLVSSMHRYGVWSKFEDERFLTLEQRFIQGMTKHHAFTEKTFADTVSDAEFKEFIATNTIKLLAKNNSHLGAFRVFQNSLNTNSLSVNYNIIKYIFPLSYVDVIQKHSTELDPIIVLSLIRQESAFNPNAASRVGARGLMQLMPATAKRFNKKVQVAQLNQPKINVELGTKYLRELFIRFDGNLIYTLGSYNAGENRIIRWKKELFRNDNPLAIIESIPFEETRNYVKLIYRNQFFYSVLHNKSVFHQSIEDSFKVTLKPENKAKLTASP